MGTGTYRVNKVAPRRTAHLLIGPVSEPSRETRPTPGGHLRLPDIRLGVRLPHRPSGLLPVAVFY